jgi:hypothetical protein
VLTTQLNLLVRAAALEARTKFISAVVPTILEYADAHPDHVHEASHILGPVTDKIPTLDMVWDADQSLLEKRKNCAPHQPQFKWMHAQFYRITF